MKGCSLNPGATFTQLSSTFTVKAGRFPREVWLPEQSRIPGDHRLLAIPDPIPNSVVKQELPMILLCEKVGIAGFLQRPQTSVWGLFRASSFVRWGGLYGELWGAQSRADREGVRRGGA